MGITLKGKLPLAPTQAVIDENIYNALVKIGQVGVEYAVEMHEFKNQTFNLQDSYGYAIYNNGKMVGLPMMADKKASEGKEFEGITYYGREEGLSALEGFDAPEQGWSLVVVAGMVYASFVEEYYGLDVLQGSEQEANEAAEKIFKNIKWESL